MKRLTPVRGLRLEERRQLVIGISRRCRDVKLSGNSSLWRLTENVQMQGIRNHEERGVQYRYTAVTKDEDNAADVGFP